MVNVSGNSLGSRSTSVESDMENSSEGEEEEDSEVKVLHMNIEEDERIRLNISGIKFETMKSTLRRFPNTRLAQLAELGENDETYDKLHHEYFFDRHSTAFESILHFYRTGELHFDGGTCGNILKQEMLFWGILESEIESCCWEEYSEHLDTKENLTMLDNVFGKDVALPRNFQKSCRMRLWVILNYPTSSRAAKVFLFISMFFTFSSIVLFMMESHFMFRVVDGPNGTYIEAPEPITMNKALPAPMVCSCHNASNPFLQITSGTPAAQILPQHSRPHPYIAWIDIGLLGYFVLEFALLLLVAPKKCEFLRSVTNIVDLVCIVAHTANLIQTNIDFGDDEMEQAAMISKAITVAFRSLRVFRVLRIFKLLKHYTGFKVLVYTIKVSTKELILIIAFLMTGVMLFASVIYFTEPETFPSIPYGFWWALVTMSTVGYGDAYPCSNMGYVVGSLCVICGLLTVAFTVPIVVKNFTQYYAHAQSRLKEPKQPVKQARVTVSVGSVSGLNGGAGMNAAAVSRQNSTESAESEVDNTKVQGALTSTLGFQLPKRQGRVKYVTGKNDYSLEVRAITDEAKRLAREKDEDKKRQILQMSLNHFKPRRRKGGWSPENPQFLKTWKRRVVELKKMEKERPRPSLSDVSGQTDRPKNATFIDYARRVRGEAPPSDGLPKF